MKRFIAIFLILLYAGVSSGTSLTLHYCMGELQGMSLNQQRSDHCENCGMLKSKALKNKCCKDKQHEFKIGKEQRVASFSFQFAALFPVVLPARSTNLKSVDVHSLAVVYPVSQSPPIGIGKPVYLLNRTFRI
ncbi:HYC_CC_PP family protein [Mucilaginibacter defluvii]|uniref:HYC_CC_PP family protein n=1 Tax=Mucilaginibacter defluvii TaxID=1196019 RepID=UPI0031EC3F9A